MSVADVQPTVPKPKRHWYQFSLRTLLIAVWTLGPVLGWIGRPICERIGRERYKRAELVTLKKALKGYPVVEDANTPEAIEVFFMRAFPKKIHPTNCHQGVES